MKMLVLSQCLCVTVEIEKCLSVLCEMYKKLKMISLNQLFSDTEKSGFLKYLLMKKRERPGLRDA